jgi:hypothetical protein
MIRMLGIIEDIPTGMNKSVYDEAIKKVESSLGLSEYGPSDLPPREVPTGFSAAKWRAKRPSSMPSQSPPPKRKPGDIWQTRQGWGAMNKDGQTKYFNGDPKEEKFDAEDFAKGTGNYSPERLSAINLAGSPKTEVRRTVESLLHSSRLQKMVKEEYKKLLEDCEKDAPKIEKKLEDMRSKMCEDFMTLERKGTFTEAAGEKRIQVNTVAELIDVPVNELMLYFLNSVKTSNERKLVEYRLGHVYFYASTAE